MSSLYALFSPRLQCGTRAALVGSMHLVIAPLVGFLGYRGRGSASFVSLPVPYPPPALTCPGLPHAAF